MSDFENSTFPGQPRNVTVFTDRRKQTDLEVLTGLIESLMGRIDSLDTKLTKHMEEEPAEIKKVLAEAFQSSFPEGDTDGHRRAHEAWIKREEDRAEFWGKMKVALAQYGLLGFAGWAIYYLWRAFLEGPK